MQIKHLQSLIQRTTPSISSLERDILCYKRMLNDNWSDVDITPEECVAGLSSSRKKLAKLVELQKALKKSLAFAVGQQKYVH